MRKYIALTAIAPLALVAACGDNDAEEDTVDTADTSMATELEPEPVEATPTPIAEAGDFSGAYTYAANDGTGTSVRLNASDDTYEYTGEDGTVRTGTYSRASDGYRLIFEDYYGSPAYFTISNGELVRLAGDVEVTDDITVTGDRFARDDNAVFSREPELGSPVAPPIGD